MNKHLKILLDFLKLIIGSALFGLGFSLFLEPNGMNGGGISGIAMIIVHLTGFATIGTLTTLINLPLFAIGGFKIGKKFFFWSLIGMISNSLFIDLCAYLPKPEIDPLVAAVYGGVLCGVGLGLVFISGGSTGGSDIIVRLLKLRMQHVPIGVINTVFDLTVVALTGFAFWDITIILCSGIAIFIMGKVIDAVIYRFDYSKVALIISKKHEDISKRIMQDLDRGVTLLHGQGGYSGQQTEVVLTAVKRQQVAELKELVVSIDPNAFIIVQEAHQVLGDGFSQYSKHSL